MDRILNFDIKKSMRSYLKNQIHAFRESFRITQFGKSFFLDACKYLLLIMLFLILLSLTLKSLYSTMPLLNTVESIRDVPKDDIPEEMINDIMEQKYLLNALLLKLSMILISLVVFSSFIESYFNNIIIDTIKKEKFHVKKFLHLSYIYTVYGIVLLTIFLSALIFSHNLLFILIILLITLLLRWYIFFTYSIAINGNSFISDVKNGLKYAAKLNWIIVPIIIAILFLFIGMSLLFYLVKIIKIYAAILLILFFISWSVWIKNYNYKLYSIFQALNRRDHE
ncbi:MAG TPA: hypothetical protein VEC16_00590 [Alphaproteobacteria bacterium]|nr:hypothetical protein [Alphaproteobacteria bacterium]